MECSKCQAPLQADDVFCKECGQKVTEGVSATAVTPPQQPAAPAAPAQAATPVAPPPTAQSTRLVGMQLENVYKPTFDISSVPDDQKEELKRHVVLFPFSVAGAIILSIITFGLFSEIYYGLKHSQLPRIKSDDFKAGQGIGYLYIPFFNLYWLFVFWLRLADRINFQFKLRGQPDAIPRGFVLAFCIVRVFLVVPLLNYVAILPLIIMGPILTGQIQSALNRLTADRDDSWLPKQYW